MHYQQEQPSAAHTLLAELLPGTGGRALGGAAPALAARVACQRADPARALRLGEQAVTMERTRGHPAGLANALDARAAARLCRGEFAAAVADLRGCLDILVTLGKPQDTPVPGPGCRQPLGSKPSGTAVGWEGSGSSRTRSGRGAGARERRPRVCRPSMTVGTAPERPRRVGRFGGGGPPGPWTHAKKPVEELGSLE
ncbi:hypothetical protein [Streptomyces sp. NPDC004658]|uniref:hypothetical protein n=1 Tax=Streptomyces sp. NPDC004658 TaxID=3154672 RepID=UPI0033BCB20B